MIKRLFLNTDKIGFFLIFSLLLILQRNCLLAENNETGKWVIQDTKGKPVARHENSFVECDGKLYLIGGRGIKPVNIYNPETKEWKEGKKTPIELHHFQAVAYKGEIYVAGAQTGGYPHEEPVKHIYIYHCEKDEWRKGAVIPEKRRRGAAGCAIYNDKLYLCCGIIDGHYDGHVKWFDEYDLVKKTWKQLPDAPRKRDHFQAVVINNKMYAASGRLSSKKTNQVFSLTVKEVDFYDFETGKWQSLPAEDNLPTLRAGASAVNFNEELFIIGGESSQKTAHNNVEVFNPEKHKWMRYPSLNRGRHGTQAVVFDNKIFIVAGSGNRGGRPELNSLEIYIPNE